MTPLEYDTLIIRLEPELLKADACLKKNKNDLKTYLNIKFIEIQYQGHAKTVSIEDILKSLESKT